MAKSKEQELRDLCIALLGAMDASRQSKKEDIWLFSSYKTFMRKYNEIALLTSKTMEIYAPIDTYKIDEVPNAFNTTTVQQRIYFDEVYANLSILKSFIEAHGGVADAEAENILNFLKANLRKAIYGEPKIEKDIQNAVGSLLVGKGLQKGINYDRETGRVKLAGKESIPDFIFPPEGMALEIKFSNKEGKLASIIDEMNADIIAYSESYRFVWFLIYDMGFVRDEDEIIDGLEKKEHIKCAIVKH
jgi:hypothetical protein